MEVSEKIMINKIAF